MKLEALSKKLPTSVMEEIPLIIEKFGIDGPLRLSHFLSQCAHESGNFKFLRENLEMVLNSEVVVISSLLVRIITQRLINL
jgi:predicted chitinase